LTYFFDRNLAVRLARMLAAYDDGNTIVHQDADNRFTPNTADVELIRALSGDMPPPVFLTADVSQRRDPVERKALADSGLTVVFFRRGWHQLSFHMQAVKLLTLWPDVVRLTTRARVPTAFEISAAARKVDDLGPTAKL
jgi:hypothetical protein